MTLERDDKGRLDINWPTLSIADGRTLGNAGFTEREIDILARTDTTIDLESEAWKAVIQRRTEIKEFKQRQGWRRSEINDWIDGADLDPWDFLRATYGRGVVTNPARPGYGYEPKIEEATARVLNWEDDLLGGDIEDYYEGLP